MAATSTQSKTKTDPILLTGGGGSLGSAIATELTENGYDLITLEHLHSSADTDLKADFADPNMLKHTVASIESRLDGLVAAHGILEMSGLEEVSPERWRHMMAANVDSVYAIIHYAHQKLRDGASIVVISSTAGLDHSPVGGPHYTASKWALNGLVRHLAATLGRRNIRINAVCPGFVNNPMGRLNMTDMDIERAIGEIPLQRAAEPREVATVVNFLMSNKASYITGALIPVSGGYNY